VRRPSEARPVNSPETLAAPPVPYPAALKREPAPQRLVLGAMAYGIPIAQLESMLAEIRENENTDEVSGLRRRRL
jgi:hypothetical protein